MLQNISTVPELTTTPSSTPSMDPFAFNPYSEFTSDEYKEHHYEVRECFLDDGETVKLPEVFAYPGLPQNMSNPFFGSYDVLKLRDDVCWDRFGRFGPYGYGYDRAEGGLGLGDQSEKVGSGKVWKQQAKIDYRKVDWGAAQQKCFEKNKRRFENQTAPEDSKSRANWKPKKLVSRQAYILRSYTGYKYDDHNSSPYAP